MAPAPDRLVGLATVDGPVTVSDSRMGIAHSLVWSTSELHTDDVAMATTAFGRRLATGPWIAALMSGLFLAGGGGGLLRDHGVRIRALRAQTVRYAQPVRAGDRLLLRCEVITCGPDPDGWALTVRGDCLVGEGERALGLQWDYVVAAVEDGAR